MYPATIHHAPGLREHRRKFRIDGQAATDRLKSALKTLEMNDEALRLALGANLCATPEKSLADVKAALRLLVEGPHGEFR
jgi:hypothetical protein